jgi:hypothetical protein
MIVIKLFLSRILIIEGSSNSLNPKVPFSTEGLFLIFVSFFESLFKNSLNIPFLMLIIKIMKKSLKNELFFNVIYQFLKF